MGEPCVLNERDVTKLWRQLFNGKKITATVLAKASSLLEGLSPESPLRFRLQSELEEIRGLRQKN